MKMPPELDIIVKKWIVKAEHDLFTSEHLLKLGKEAPLDVICFHSQQGIEKYLKALLVYAGVGFPKTHDLGKLLKLLPENYQKLFSINEISDLTPYATDSRYLEGMDTETPEDAIFSCRIALTVKKIIIGILPKHITEIEL